MTDCVINLRVKTEDIAFLVQVMEGHGHLGVVTTTNPQSGEVVISVTPDTYAEVMFVLKNIPIQVQFDV
ncbi:MAG TPA: DUF4911 domain-containing protein [Desulfobacteria bacterium]|nr:DUF4911 domain-containing protein [Desulfobacteria bacterium]